MIIKYPPMEGWLANDHSIEGDGGKWWVTSSNLGLGDYNKWGDKWGIIIIAELKNDSEMQRQSTGWEWNNARSPRYFIKGLGTHKSVVGRGGLSSSWKWKTTVNWGNQSTGREWNNAYLGIISSKVWGLIRELLSDNAMSSTLSMEIRKTCVHI